MICMEWFQRLIDSIVQLLPTSPIRPFLNEFASLPYLGYVNWFIPVGSMLRVFSAWLVAVTVFYIYSAIARYVKLVE